jgi:hypothetical protein
MTPNTIRPTIEKLGRSGFAMRSIPSNRTAIRLAPRGCAGGLLPHNAATPPPAGTGSGVGKETAMVLASYFAMR